MTNITATFLRGDEVARMIESVATFAAGPFDDKTVSSDVHNAVTRRLSQVFQTQGSAYGMRWRSLSRTYAAWKDAHYPGRPLMVLTGRTKDSLLDRWDPEHVFAARKGRLVVGSDVPYARYHQQGSKRLPVRPILQVSDGDPMVMSIAELFTTAARNRFGGGI